MAAVVTATRPGRTGRSTHHGVLLWLAILLSTAALVRSEQQEVYGTQCSFAITGQDLDGCDPNLLDHRQQFYKEFLHSCYHHYSKEDCLSEEAVRLAMNQRQPQSMVNMTQTGYLKLKAPDSLMTLLLKFWEANKDDKELEEWYDGSIYTNHWESPTYMVSVEQDDLEGGGQVLKQAIWDAAIDGIAEWTGGVAKLRPVSLYGIREYTQGSILAPHVDRVPLVSSGIVNVAQDVDEPWPLEVYDRHGKAQNITMEPGDMVLYESHSLIHGRPFPLQGRYYANIFIHFEPFDGWETARSETNLGDNNGDLPPYILPGSPEEAHYRAENPNGWSKHFAEGDAPPVGAYAKKGDLEALKEAAAMDLRVLGYQDENGWTPIHEAVRAGHMEIVQYLVQNGADVNTLTGAGETPLRIAIHSLGTNHPIYKYLEGLGAEAPMVDADFQDDLDEYTEDGGDEEEEHDEDMDEEEEEDEEYMDDDEYFHLSDIVPTIVGEIEEEIVPAIRYVEEKVPEIVPTIVREFELDDDEEL